MTDFDSGKVKTENRSILIYPACWLFLPRSSMRSRFMKTKITGQNNICVWQHFVCALRAAAESRENQYLIS